MKVQRTVKGNIKIVMNEDEALALARLMNASHDVVNDGTHRSCYKQEDETLIGGPMWNGLYDVGIVI